MDRNGSRAVVVRIKNSRVVHSVHLTTYTPDRFGIMIAYTYSPFRLPDHQRGLTQKGMPPRGQTLRHKLKLKTSAAIQI